MRPSRKEQELRRLHRDYQQLCRDFKSTYLAQNGFCDQAQELLEGLDYKYNFTSLADSGSGSITYIYAFAWLENGKIRLYTAEF